MKQVSGSERRHRTIVINALFVVYGKRGTKSNFSPIAEYTRFAMEASAVHLRVASDSSTEIQLGLPMFH